MSCACLEKQIWTLTALVTDALACTCCAIFSTLSLVDARFWSFCERFWIFVVEFAVRICFNRLLHIQIIIVVNIVNTAFYHFLEIMYNRDVYCFLEIM